MPPPSFNQEDSDLIASLHALSAKNPKLVRSSAYPAPADAGVTVRSWKMNEFKYYDIPSPFPTLARGLFSREVEGEVGEGEGGGGGDGDGGKRGKRYQIVVRGYDKFFNIGEVPWTTWASIETHTAPPYTLSLKSNGCIIFIAALTPTRLVITSKHSLGPVEAAEVSHAQAGEAWLRRYLKKLGKEEQDIAKELWERNWTAVAELCDDSFEEHVLGYPPEKTGLHLHGLNVRSKDFTTMPTETVDAFADRWGFIKTPTITLNTVQEVKEFTSACAETGEWNGEQVEGFVVRTRVTEPPTGKERQGGGNEGGGDRPRRSPYKAGSSFFFKVKFDEPYMMYRDWREVTKSLLTSFSKNGEMSASNLPKSKMKRPETQLYVKWVINEIKNNRAAFKDYAKGKGIIATREKYLAWIKSDKGGKELEELEKKKTEETGEKAQKHFDKTIIVPIAIPGCGKTAVSVALAHIFGFGHTQSDDIRARKAGPVFIKNVKALLEKNDVVIADKNNHLTQHREALHDLASHDFSSVRLLALNWSLDRPPAMVHRICSDRILERDQNHQSLRADPSAARAHEEVLWMFINSYEELLPSEVDEVIEMELDDTLEQSVRRAVEGCVRVLGVPRPGEERIKEALEVVGKYEPATKKPDDPKASKKSGAGTPRYFGLLPEIDIISLLDKRLSEADVDQEMKTFWKQLKENGRVTRRPHVTIVHKNNKDAEKELWERCSALHAMNENPPTFKGSLTSVVCDDRVMALTVGDFGVEVVIGEGEGQEGSEFVSALPEEVRKRLHITVGTQKEGIPAVEAMGLVKLLKEKGEGEGEGAENEVKVKANAKVVELKDVTFRARVKGLNN